MMVLRQLLALGILTALGMTLPGLLRRKGATEVEWGGVERSLPERAALGFFLGTAIAGLAGQTFIWMGGTLTRGWWLSFFAAAGALSLLMGAWNHRHVVRASGSLRLALRRALPESPLAWAFMALVLLSLVWMFRQAYGLPLLGWDPLSFWYLKTKILFAEGTTQTADFLAPYRVHFHTTYPILLNIVESGLCHAMGDYAEQPLKGVWGIWMAAALTVAGYGMARRRGATIGWACVVLLALLPALTATDTTGGVSGYRDAPLALLVLAACVLWSDCLEHPRAGRADHLALIALLVLLIGCKREGTAWALILAVPALAALPGGLRRPADACPPSGPCRATAALYIIAIPFFLMLPWYFLHAGMPYPRTENYAEMLVQQDWNTTTLRVAPVLALFRDDLFLRVQKWGVLWWVFCAVGLWRRGAWTPTQRMLALVVVLGWGVAMLGFLYTPWPSPKEHMAVGVDRLILQSSLAALWLTVLNLTRPRSD